MIESSRAIPPSPFFYDVTLRDGNQALKRPWNQPEKEVIFQLLCELGVQEIEAGYPGASKMDFDCVSRLLAKASAGVVIGALARANSQDIDSAIKALSYDTKATRRLHAFIALSPDHMEKVLHKSPDQVRQLAVNAVDMARQGMEGLGGQVQFSPEHFGDCSQNLDWVIKTLQAVVEAGAGIINLPNTVERTRPSIFAAMVQRVVEALPKQVVVAVHCHNDLGMATATTVESFFAGAKQLEVTLNGLGERAGNTNLYEVAVALYLNGVNIDLDLEKIFETAVRVAEMSGIPIPEKAPLLGPEVFIHRSGIHQDGAIKTSKEEKGAYRPIDPAWIGRAGDEECEFTSQSGSAALRRIILETGRSISDQEARILQPALKAVSENRGVLSQEELAAVYDAFKELEKRKPEIEVADMAALAENVISTRGQRTWELKNIQATAGTVATQTAMIILIRDGREFKGVAMGDGPVDAAFEAIRQITGVDCKLESYQIKPVTKGKAAQGEATVVLSLNGLQCEGHNAHTDIVVASAKAYLHALNRLLRGEVNGAKSS